MTFGMAPLAATLLLFGQTAIPELAPAPTRVPVPVPAIRGEKPIEVPAVFAKRVPESPADLKAIEAHVKELTKKVIPATVGIRIGGSSGSGVIINEAGIVLTAGHVSGDAGRECTLILHDGRKLKGKTLGANRTIDSGMIQITEKAEFSFLEMSNSSPLKRGDWCLAIGHPGGFQTGRTPVVRVGRVLDATATFLRTDCTLVGGDSGGPLIDMKGKVIGIHSRIGGPITANIHVPVDTYRDTWDRLAKAEIWGPNIFGQADAFMGIEMDPEAKSCRVNKISPSSPAEKAGLKVDDVILKFGGAKIGTADDFMKLIRNRRPGDEISVDVQRGETMLQLRVVLGKRPVG